MAGSFLDPVDVARRESRRTALTIPKLSVAWESIAGGTMSFGGEGAWTNFAVGLGLDGPVKGSDVDRLVRFYEDRGVEPTVELCPIAHDSLMRALADRGFVLREFESVFARSLRPEENLEGASWPDGLEIVAIDRRDETEVRAFIDVSTSGFRQAGEVLDPANEAYLRRSIGQPRTRSFLALLEGRPVGGGSLDLGEDISCLFGTSVLPAFRRRGIQQALMRYRLERCRDAGCRVVTIHSMPGAPTERNALRLGFRLMYMNVVLARPRPAQRA